MLGLVGYGISNSSGTQPVAPRETAFKNIIVSRSHAGQVEDLVRKTFDQEQYRVVQAGGAGYKVLSLILGSAG